MLALWLLLDRDCPGSFFAPYHATLPPPPTADGGTHSTARPDTAAQPSEGSLELPLQWSEAARELLRGTSAEHSVSSQVSAIAEDLQALHALGGR